MLQLKNNTPFAAKMALFPNEAGIDTLYLIVRATFKIGQQWTLVEKQPLPTVADVYWTDPVKSSLKYASDFHTGKLATDIVMVGHACAPGQREVAQLDVSLSVGQVNKQVRVFGDREWQNGRITNPKPFQTMALVYEKAYGGVHIVDGQIQSAEMRNPVGCGFAGKRSANDMNGVPLPNLEDPGQLIQQYKDKVNPACFGFSAPSWQPRVAYAGTYDAAWQQQRAPYLPDDFDKRFFNMAHPDLVYPGFIQGGESVQISNMHPGGDLQFNVPETKLVSRISIDKQEQHPDFKMETLLIEPNQLQLSMIWKASLTCDKKALKIGEVNIGLSR